MVKEVREKGPFALMSMKVKESQGNFPSKES